MTWNNRIVGEGEVSPSDILDHPENWRRHPSVQRSAMEGALEEVGWVQRIVVNQETGRIIDGHLRAELARSRGDDSVPVLYVNLSSEEERVVLASMDTITGLAERDDQAFADLLSSLDVENDQLSELIDTERMDALSRLSDDDNQESGNGEGGAGGNDSDMLSFDVMMRPDQREYVERILSDVRDQVSIETIADALVYVCSLYEEGDT